MLNWVKIIVQKDRIRDGGVSEQKEGRRGNFKATEVLQQPHIEQPQKSGLETMQKKGRSSRAIYELYGSTVEIAQQNGNFSREVKNDNMPSIKEQQLPNCVKLLSAC